MLNHPWITKAHQDRRRDGPKLTLKELLDISDDWRQENKKTFVLENFKNNLLFDFGFDSESADKKLIQVIS